MRVPHFHEFMPCHISRRAIYAMMLSILFHYYLYDYYFVHTTLIEAARYVVFRVDVILRAIATALRERALLL